MLFLDALDTDNCFFLKSQANLIIIVNPLQCWISVVFKSFKKIAGECLHYSESYKYSQKYISLTNLSCLAAVSYFSVCNFFCKFLLCCRCWQTVLAWPVELREDASFVMMMVLLALFCVAQTGMYKAAASIFFSFNHVNYFVQQNCSGPMTYKSFGI